MQEADDDEIWYQSNMAVFLNRWFSNYADARKSLEEEGGFLLPYKHHFFVCEAGAIRALGLDSDDPDWERVGWDCVKPAEQQALQRLQEKRMKVLQIK